MTARPGYRRFQTVPVVHALRWDATPGSHALAVRATDGEGEAQTGEIVPPFPDGATGYHEILVDVI